jgi:hypothetical protein
VATPSGKGLNAPVFGRPAWQVALVFVALAALAYYLWKRHEANSAASTDAATDEATGDTDEGSEAGEFAAIEEQLADLSAAIAASPGAGGSTPTVAPYTPPGGGTPYSTPNSPTGGGGSGPPATTTGNGRSGANKTYLDVDVEKARADQLAAEKAREAGHAGEAEKLNREATERKAAEKGARKGRPPARKAKPPAGTRTR